MSLYARLASLPLHVEDVGCTALEQRTRHGWLRRTTVVRLHGPDGQAGLGEDVTYIEDEQRELMATARALPLAGTHTLDSFSRTLDAIPLFAQTPLVPAAQCYRRWALESAALDLALRQAGMSLAQALDRTPAPVRFVVSMGLGEPPSLDALRALRARDPNLRFKLDLSEGWTNELVADLARLRCVVAVDFKGQYRGAYRGPLADPDLYRRVVRGLPDAWIEDPDLDKRLRKALAGCEHHITWDAPIQSVADILQLEFPPGALNMKPSRFGLLSEVLRAYEFCAGRGIAMYGGGQFELGPGRDQIQCLASLFHPDADNDVAPVTFHGEVAEGEQPTSPLPDAFDAPGFGVRPGRSAPPSGDRSRNRV